MNKQDVRDAMERHAYYAHHDKQALFDDAWHAAEAVKSGTGQAAIQAVKESIGRGKTIFATHKLIYGRKTDVTLPPPVPHAAVAWIQMPWGHVATSEQHRIVALVAR